MVSSVLFKEGPQGGVFAVLAGCPPGFKVGGLQADAIVKLVSTSQLLVRFPELVVIHAQFAPAGEIASLALQPAGGHKVDEFLPGEDEHIVEHVVQRL